MGSSREPARRPPDDALSLRMSRLARRHTRPELELRRELHSRGLRYRVQVKVPGNNRRTIDIAFTRAKFAVYVDGCFWHGCPEHHVTPKANNDWWRWKIERNQERDRDTDRLLEGAGWRVVRIWEHEDMAVAAERIAKLWHARQVEDQSSPGT